MVVVRAWLVTEVQSVVMQEDLDRVKEAGGGRVDITVGSALDIFGGRLPYADVLAWHRVQQRQPQPVPEPVPAGYG